jgi:hypothetical protein
VRSALRSAFDHPGGLQPPSLHAHHSGRRTPRRSTGHMAAAAFQSVHCVHPTRSCTPRQACSGWRGPRMGGLDFGRQGFQEGCAIAPAAHAHGWDRRSRPSPRPPPGPPGPPAWSYGTASARGSPSCELRFRYSRHYDRTCSGRKIGTTRAERSCVYDGRYAFQRLGLTRDECVGRVGSLGRDKIRTDEQTPFPAARIPTQCYRSEVDRLRGIQCIDREHRMNLVAACPPVGYF